MNLNESPLSSYKHYYIDRQFERLQVFAALKAAYSIETCLYPGSFVHITPSFVFPECVFVDNDKGAKRFFTDMEIVLKYIDSRKNYPEEPSIRFYGESYHNQLPLEPEHFDLLVSHYAGIISQPCKKYLKKRGLLLVNNSHADAGVAYLDPDFKLIGTIMVQRKNLISEENLAEYFIPKKNQSISIENLISSQKGIGYTKTADLYIFRKTK